jgi:hypothetical protein
MFTAIHRASSLVSSLAVAHSPVRVDLTNFATHLTGPFVQGDKELMRRLL